MRVVVHGNYHHVCRPAATAENFHPMMIKVVVKGNTRWHTCGGRGVVFRCANMQIDTNCSGGVRVDG